MRKSDLYKTQPDESSAARAAWVENKTRLIIDGGCLWIPNQIKSNQIKAPSEWVTSGSNGVSFPLRKVSDINDRYLGTQTRYLNKSTTTLAYLTIQSTRNTFHIGVDGFNWRVVSQRLGHSMGTGPTDSSLFSLSSVIFFFVFNFFFFFLIDWVTVSSTHGQYRKY